MFKGFARDARTIAISVAVSAIVIGVPAMAAVVATNSDKVDGLHAVTSSTSVTDRAGKLVATNPHSGRLPNNIIRKAPDAKRLGGLPATDYALAPAFATVRYDGVLLTGRGVVSSSQLATGIYLVEFANPVNSCAVITSALDGFDTIYNVNGVRFASGTPNQIKVYVRDASGTAVDDAFSIVAIC